MGITTEGQYIPDDRYNINGIHEHCACFEDTGECCGACDEDGVDFEWEDEDEEDDRDETLRSYQNRYGLW